MIDFTKPETILNLDNIRRELVRMEDTIIFKLIERSYFPTCPVVYSANDERLKLPNFDGSFLDWALLHIEQTQSQIRRFESPDELAFFPDKILPSILPPLNYPKILAPYEAEVNYNTKIKETYIQKMVPMVSKNDSNSWENLGSVGSCDIECLQALSRRIHFGRFVAEAKFQANKDSYVKMIKEKDVAGLMASITNVSVEAKILERLEVKARVYGIDPTSTNDNDRKITPSYLVKIYKDFVIPLTKEVEIEYLLRRLECPY